MFLIKIRRGLLTTLTLLASVLHLNGKSHGEQPTISACPGNVKEQTCFVVDGTNFTRKFQANTPDDCCDACQKTPTICDMWQWNYPNNTVINSQKICSLIKGFPSIKNPLHPAQKECVISLPPSPPPLPPAPSGIGNENFRVVGANWTTMPEHFKNNGYFTTGVGKTFHPNSPPNFDQPMSWSNLTEFPYDYPAVTSCPKTTDVWCRIDNESAYFEDYAILTEAKRRLGAAASDPSGRPFFVAVGFHKPHTPYRVPGEFFDLYPPVEEIAVATEQNFPSDQNLTGLAWFGCLAEGKQYPIQHNIPYPTTVQQLLRRAYYAAVSFTDHNIGQLLEYVDTLQLTDKIIVAFHADHGYQDSVDPSTVSMVTALFNASFSQYARKRCYDDMFLAKPCASGAPGTFIGYSVRVAGYRYTRWVNVTTGGDPFWEEVIGEEFYNENVTSNDFDSSETKNIMYVSAARNDTAIGQLQDALRRHHLINSGRYD